MVPDEACQAVPTREGPCRVHGAGGGAPIRTGRYSRVMRRWSKSFDRALGDESLLDTKPDVAMMDVLIEKLTRRAEFKDCPSWRADLRDTYGELQAAMRSKRQADVAVQLERLGELIEHGATHDQMADDLMAHIDRGWTTSRSTAKRDMPLGRVLPALMTLIRSGSKTKCGWSATTGLRSQFRLRVAWSSSFD